MSNLKQSPIRSWLFTPATRSDRFTKASESGSDVAIVDLEDSVAPSEKKKARQIVISYLTEDPSRGTSLALRINSLDTPAGIEDIDFLLKCRVHPEYLILPKTDSASHLQILDHLLMATGSHMLLVGLIESLQGLNAVEKIAISTPRLAGLMFGAADMAADIGIKDTWPPLAHMRSRIVNACSSANIAAIDAPYFNVHDLKGLEAESQMASDYGFTSKAAIHPNQVGVINDTFTPTESEIAYARSILAESTNGVGSVKGMMVDEAVARQARRVLARAGLGK